MFMLMRVAIAIAGLGFLVSRVNLKDINLTDKVSSLINPANAVMSQIAPVLPGSPKLKSEPITEVRQFSLSTKTEGYQDVKAGLDTEAFCKTYIDYCRQAKREGGK